MIKINLKISFLQYYKPQLTKSIKEERKMETRFPQGEMENIQKRLQKLFTLVVSTTVDDRETGFLDIRNRVTQLYNRSRDLGLVSRQSIEEIIEDVRLYLDILNGEDNYELQKFKKEFESYKF